MDAKLKTRGLKLYYGDFQALNGVDLEIKPLRITAIIGPSGCGKSTLLRTFNRMNDMAAGIRIEGEILLDDRPVLGPQVDLVDLRRRVGMVFQRPNPFPLSVFENVAYGPRIHGLGSGTSADLEERVRRALAAVHLWDGLKDRLRSSALALPAEIQQRLCIARLLAAEPEVLLLDEPCSALDSIATARIEELLLELKSRYTVVIVTHNMQQAARISEETAFMLLGDLIEFGPTQGVFTLPKDPKTEAYVTGRYG